MPMINQITDTVPLQKSGGTGLDIFSAGLADGAGRIVDSGGSPVWSWDENGVVSAKGLPRVLHVNVTPVTNSVTANQNLMTFTVPGGTLANDGDALRVTAILDVIGAEDNEIELQFGGMMVNGPLIFGTLNTRITAEMLLVRTGASAVLGSAKFFGSLPETDSYLEYAFSTAITDPSVSLAADQAIQVAVASGATNTVTQKLLQVVYEPAPV